MGRLLTPGSRHRAPALRPRAALRLQNKQAIFRQTTSYGSERQGALLPPALAFRLEPSGSGPPARGYRLPIFGKLPIGYRLPLGYRLPARGCRPTEATASGPRPIRPLGTVRPPVPAFRPRATALRFFAKPPLADPTVGAPSDLRRRASGPGHPAPGYCESIFR